jgi:hypothetical protein
VPEPNLFTLRPSDLCNFKFLLSMKIPSVSTTFFLSCINLATCQQQILGAQPLLRNASLKDADDIASVIIAAFSPLPSWQYLYQFHEKYPKEHHRCVRFGVTQALTAASYHVEVIEAPAESNLMVAAVAIWRQNTPHDGMFLHQLFSKENTMGKRCALTGTKRNASTET